MELPLPQDDPGARRAGLRSWRPTWSGSGARTSPPSAPTTPTPAMSSGCARCCSTSSTCGGHPGVPGLGRPDRAAPGGRAPGPLRPGGGGQHLPAHGRHLPGEAFLAWQRFSQEVDEFPTGFIVNGGCPPTCRPRSWPPTTHPSPTRATRRGPASSRMLVPATPDDPAHDANLAAWEVLAPSTGRSCPPSATRPHHRGPDRPAGADRRRPGPAPHHHRGRRPLPPGGPGRGAGRVVVDFVASTS